MKQKAGCVNTLQGMELLIRPADVTGWTKSRPFWTWWQLCATKSYFYLFIIIYSNLNRYFKDL